MIIQMVKSIQIIKKKINSLGDRLKKPTLQGKYIKESNPPCFLLDIIQI